MVEVDALSRDVLRAMSEDCRRSISSLAKELHCAPKTLKKRLAILEDEYKLRYTLELDEHELGFDAAYVVLIRFSKPPDEKVIRNALAKYPTAQFAAFTKGDFDMILFAAARTPYEFARWANYFRQALSDFMDSWEGSVVTGYWFGFFPLNEDVLTDLPIEESKRIMLRLLLRNARISLKEIARRMNMPVSTAQYHLRKLLSSKAVRRATIVMERPPLLTHYVGAHSYKLTHEFLKRDLKVREFITSEGGFEPMNRLLMAFNMSAASFDDVILYAVDNTQDGHQFNEKLDETLKPELRSSRSAFITKVLKGNVPCRKLNVKENYRVTTMGIYDFMEK